MNDELGLTSRSLQRHNAGSGNCRSGFDAEVTAEQIKAQVEPSNRSGRRLDRVLVAAREGDSQYIWSAHEPAALKAGVAQPVIDAVKYGKDVSSAGEKETVVVRMGRQILREHKLDSATFAKAVDLFGKQGTVELVILMGDYTLNAMLLDALDQHLPADRKPLLPPR
jgi:hypothetical protein